MKKVGVAILGLGVVGGGTYKIISEHKQQYLENYGLEISVESVLELNRDRALALGIEEGKIASNISEVCSNPEVDIVVECLGGVEPAKSFLITAFSAGKSVVTSNKELYCKCGCELEKAAKRNNVGLYYEATCAGGVPVIRALTDNLQGNKIRSLIGIINGTTNYILTKMVEEGRSYEDVLQEAQRLGYAEADPTADVEGYDAVYKLSILSSLAFHKKIPYTEIYREGISGVSAEDIAYGKHLGYTVKLLAIGKDGDKGVEARVHPAFIKVSHPLSGVRDSYNAVYVTGDSVGEVMLYGKGAGEFPTGSAIVGDIIYCALHARHNYTAFNLSEKENSAVKFITDFKSAYYLRLIAEDKAGELSKVTAILGKYGISVAQVIQDTNEEERKNGKAHIIMVTYKTREESVKKAVSAIRRDLNTNVASVIRVVE